MRIKARAPVVILLTLMVLTFGCPTKKPSVCKNPEYVEVMKEQAASFYKRGNYIEALKSANDAAACNPKDAELYYWLGLIYFKKDKSYEAIAALQKSLEIDPGYFESRMALGIVYLDLERWDEAIEQFQMAADDDYFPRPWEAYNNIGWAQMQKGEYDKAELSFNQAIKLKPNYCPAYSNLGELKSKQKKSAEAIQYYKKAISQCPNVYARPYMLLGIEYGQLGRYNEACANFSTAAAVPSAPEAEKAMDYLRLYDCPNVVLPPKQ